MFFADWSISNLFFLEPLLLVDYVPTSQPIVFYRFVMHIHKNIRAKKLRFYNQMNLTVESNMRSLAFNDNYPKHNFQNYCVFQQYR